VIVEIMNDDGTMARRPELEVFAQLHGLKIGTIADLIRYRLRNERTVERIAERQRADRIRRFRLLAYEDHVHRDVHLALVQGRHPDGSSAAAGARASDRHAARPGRRRSWRDGPGRCARRCSASPRGPVA
jgi:hypothetical protein